MKWFVHWKFKKKNNNKAHFYLLNVLRLLFEAPLNFRVFVWLKLNRDLMTMFLYGNSWRQKLTYKMAINNDRKAIDKTAICFVYIGLSHLLYHLAFWPFEEMFYNDKLNDFRFMTRDCYEWDQGYYHETPPWEYHGMHYEINSICQHWAPVHFSSPKCIQLRNKHKYLKCNAKEKSPRFSTFNAILHFTS